MTDPLSCELHAWLRRNHRASVTWREETWRVLEPERETLHDILERHRREGDELDRQQRNIDRLLAEVEDIRRTIREAR